MTWTLIRPQSRASWVKGMTIVRSIKFAVNMPEDFVGEIANWYYDERENVAKLQIENSGIKKIAKQITIPKTIKENFGELTAICYLDDKTLYFGSYKRGLKSMMDFLRKEHVSLG